MYCTKCNSPRNTTINLPPLATEPDGSPPHTAEPELPFSDTLPAGRSDGRESEMNNSFIVIDDPQSEPPKTEKEIIDGKFHLSHCVAMIFLVIQENLVTNYTG